MSQLDILLILENVRAGQVSQIDAMTSLKICS